MLDLKRKLKIEERTSNADFSIDLDDKVLGINIENAGTAIVYIAWNENAGPGKGIILPGTGKPYGLGWPHVLANQKISFAFASTGSKNVCVTIFRDAGPISNCPTN